MIVVVQNGAAWIPWTRACRHRQYPDYRIRIDMTTTPSSLLHINSSNINNKAT